MVTVASTTICKSRLEPPHPDVLNRQTPEHTTQAIFPKIEALEHQLIGTPKVTLCDYIYIHL